MIGGPALCDEVVVTDLYRDKAITGQRVATAFELAAERCELHFFQLQSAVSEQRFHFRLWLRIHLRFFRSHPGAEFAKWPTRLTTHPRFVPSSTRLYPCRHRLR